MEKEEFVRLTEISPDINEELSKIEKDIFDEAGFNRFTIPMLVFWGRYYIFKINENIVAGAQVIRNYDDSAEAFIAGFWVQKEFRGQGIGKRFLKNIIKQKSSDGVKRIYLTVDPANERAVSFYEKSGFEVVSLKKDYYGKGVDRLIMKNTFS